MPALNPPRRLLFGPGPSQVESRVYEAMSKPLVGYLDPFLFQVFDEVRNGLRAVFGTKNPYTLVIPGTGSSGMETAVTNFVEPGAKLAIFVNGFFCERIAEMGRRHGAHVVRAEKPWGEVFTEAEARAFLEKERPQVVAFVHGDLYRRDAGARSHHRSGARSRRAGNRGLRNYTWLRAHTRG